MDGIFNVEKAQEVYKEPVTPAADTPKGDEGADKGDKGEGNNPEPKIGEAGYVLKEGDPGYVAPAAQPELKLGDAGYVLKEGDPGYTAPAAEPKVDNAATEAIVKAQQDLLNKLGVKTLEELEEKLKVPETPEQVAQRAAEFETAVDQHAIKSGRMTLQQVAAFKNMKTAEPGALVKGNFEAAYKAVHPDASAEILEQQYRAFYHLDSTDENLKKAGEERIKNEAAQLVATEQEKYTQAENEIKLQATQRAQMPAFRAAVQGALKNALPEKVTLFAPEKGDPIVYEVTKEDRDEIEKFLVNNHFGDFLDQTADKPAQKLMEDAAVGYLKLKRDEVIRQRIFEAGVSAGKLQGSNTGAAAPFETPKPEVATVSIDEALKEGDAKAKNLFGGPMR